MATGSHAGAFNYGTVSNVLKSNVNVSTSYADFDQAYDPINGLTYQNTSSQYTVAAGDTLQSIAYQIWGDASFWYMIADANGLMGDETLSAGQVLTIPNKVHNSHNTSDVFRVYDPNEAIGNNSPTAPKPQKHHSGGCGGIGQILVAVVSIAVTLALPGIGGALGASSRPRLAASRPRPSAVPSARASRATGIQSKFNWGAVAMAAVSAGVSAGIGPQGLNVFGSIGNATVQAALTQATASAITQGIGVATGLQNKFDWAGVAAAGVSGGVSAAVGSSTGIAANFVGALAGAGVATLINGRDFGDNILSVLPSVLGQTIGNAVAEGMQGTAGPWDVAKDTGKQGAWSSTFANSLQPTSASSPYLNDGTYKPDLQPVSPIMARTFPGQFGPLTSEQVAEHERMAKCITPNSFSDAAHDILAALPNSLIRTVDTFTFNPLERMANSAHLIPYRKEGFGKFAEIGWAVVTGNILGDALAAERTVGAITEVGQAANEAVDPRLKLRKLPGECPRPHALGPMRSRKLADLAFGTCQHGFAVKRLKLISP